MKRMLLLTAVLAGVPLFAAVKMNISGQKSPEEVSEKDGVYTVAPGGRTRIQLFPGSGHLPVMADSRLEISAEVSGSGNVQLGLHLYSSSRRWLGSAGGKMIRVDSETPESVKALLPITKSGVAAVLPWISVHSGKVAVSKLSVRLIGALDAENLADAPKLPGWTYGKNSRAIKCASEDGTLRILTAKGQTVEMISAHRPAKDGDVFRFSGKVSGKGKLMLGLHLYTKNNVWQATQWSAMPLDGSTDAVFPSLTVKSPAGKGETGFIRAAFRVMPESDVKIGEIKVGN